MSNLRRPEPVTGTTPTSLAPSLPSIHTVFSVDASGYLQWQAELLAYSHWRTGQPGPLTRLWSGDGEPQPFGGQTVQMAASSPHPFTGDDYPPYNRLTALDVWLRESPPLEDTILLLDPDCVFVSPIMDTVQRGHPVSQPVQYMDPARHIELVRRHCRRSADVQGIGIPTLIHRDDLTELAPLWIAKTEAIRVDAKSREQAGWTSDMWGYVCAAAELGLRHELRCLAGWQMDDHLDNPMIHYCYASNNPSGTWAWSKRSYRPWDPVRDPPPDTPLASIALVNLVNKWAAIQRQQLMLRNDLSTSGPHRPRSIVRDGPRLVRRFRAGLSAVARRA